MFLLKKPFGFQPNIYVHGNITDLEKGVLDK